MNPFIKAVTERAVKTFLQTFIAIAGTANLFDLGSTADALGVAFSAAVLSVLTSFASAQFGANGPSLAGEHIEPSEVSGH
jgi:predicted Kef-type K+ transport protein